MTPTLYFDANKEHFPNQDVITIADYGRRSDRFRFFVIDLKTGAVKQYHTTHGVGSDPNDTGFAQSFSNVNMSGQSSLGFARASELYSGTFGNAVRLDGLSPSNSLIRDRDIVVHGWNDAHEANIKQKRTHGCLALDWSVRDEVVNRIHGGSLLMTGVSAQ